MNDDSDSNEKEETPGPLKSELVWTEWKPKFVNYLSTILGVNGITLSYVIRENEEPNREGPFENFNEKCIMKAPLSGVAYEYDCISVHQYFISFTTVQPSENFIRPVLSHSYGSKTMHVLFSHFEGEGNATRMIDEADRLHYNLHYKIERSMKFENFLTKAQKMYNIYYKYKEEMNDYDMIRFLFKKVQHTGLKGSVEEMKEKVYTSPPYSVTYTMVTNHLMSAVTELPEYVTTTQNISGVSTNETGSGNYNSVTNKDGSINTGNYINWNKLSREDHKAVIA